MSDLTQDRPLDGRTALVTGSSRGLGAATARHLAAWGARVVVTYRESAEQAAEAIALMSLPGLAGSTARSSTTTGWPVRDDGKVLSDGRRPSRR